MILPIQFPAPQRDKYIDEETRMFARWFIFGEHNDGCVDVADSEGDILQHVPKDRAMKIIERRNAFVNDMLDLIR